jgi:rare lipoprotein A
MRAFIAGHHSQLCVHAVAYCLTAGLMTSCTSTRPQAPAPSPPPSAPEIERMPEPVPRAEPRSAKGNPPFYDVLGKRYFVMANSVGYVERGVASWYGPGFHTGSTSNGERYDMYALTAAHKTLPLPAYVQVTNLRNGRSVTVRVNDRGPFKDGRIIDLSYTAASKLDMLRDGTTFVEVRAITPQQPSATAAPAVTAPTAGALPLYVQAGAFATEANATKLLTQLRTQGVERGFIRQDLVNGQAFYRVRLGPVSNVRAFDDLIARLKRLGVTDARLAID